MNPSHAAKDDEPTPVSRKVEAALNRSMGNRIYTVVITSTLTMLVTIPLTFGLTMTQVVKQVWINTHTLNTVVANQTDLKVMVDANRKEANERVLTLANAITANTQSNGKMTDAVNMLVAMVAAERGFSPDKILPRK